MRILTLRQAKDQLIKSINLLKKENALDFSKGYLGINDPLAELLGITIVEKKLDYDFGAYIPVNENLNKKPLVLLDLSSQDRDRLNFSYYHEISHHLIRIDNDLYSFLNELAYKDDEFERLVDQFANIGAAEFLLPFSEVDQVCSHQGFSIQLIPQLEKKFPASKIAIAIQLSQVASHKCFVVVCKRGKIPADELNQIQLFQKHVLDPEKLFIEYYSSSPSLDQYKIGKNSIISKEHLLYQAFQNKEYIKGRDYIPFKNGNKNWIVECEALFYKYKVYGVFNIDPPKPKSSQQPSLF